MGSAAGAAKSRAKQKAKGVIFGTGRPPGAKNKITKDLKKVYLQAFEKLGGLQGLVDWGEKSPDLFYGQISKLLPKGIEIKTDQELTINIITAIPEPLPLPAEYARVIEKTGPEDGPQSTATALPIPKAGHNKVPP